MKFVATTVDTSRDVTHNLFYDVKNDFEALVVAAAIGIYGYESVQEFYRGIEMEDDAEWRAAICKGDVKSIKKLMTQVQDDEVNAEYLMNVTCLNNGVCLFEYILPDSRVVNEIFEEPESFDTSVFNLSVY